MPAFQGNSSIRIVTIKAIDEGEEHRLLVPQHVDDVRVGVYPVPKVEHRLRSADALRVCAERPTLGHKIEKSEAGTEWTTTEAMVEPEPRPKRWQRSYLLQAFSAALVGIRKRYRKLAQFKKKREIDDG